MEHDTETTLLQCLESLEQGDELEAILARHPNHAQQIRPILELSRNLSLLHEEPSSQARNHSRQSCLSAARSMRTPSPRQEGLRLAQRFALLYLIIILLAGMVVFAVYARSGQGSQFLSNVGSQIEHLFSPATPVKTTEPEFVLSSIDEIRLMLESGGEGAVEFSGPIEHLGDMQWQIAGLPVEVPPDAVVLLDPLIGQEVDVKATVESGQVIARSIRPAGILVGTPTPTPVPDITSTPESSGPHLVRPGEETATPTPPANAPIITAEPPPPGGGDTGDSPGDGQDHSEDEHDEE